MSGADRQVLVALERTFVNAARRAAYAGSSDKAAAYRYAAYLTRQAIAEVNA